MVRVSFVLLYALLLGACSGAKFTSVDTSFKSGSASVGKEGGEGDDTPGEVVQPGGDEDEGEVTQPSCVKLESLREGQAITIDGVKVTIKDLIYKDDSGEGGEVAGFHLESESSQISFLIKAGGEGYEGTGKSWVNPNGTGGSKVKAISHVTFCIGVPPGDIEDPSLPRSEE